MNLASGPSIALDRLGDIIALAREFDAKVARSGLTSGSNPTDDKQAAVLEDFPGDPAEKELRQVIDALNEDEQIDLVALVWIGRGDGTREDWPDIRARAYEAHNDRTAAYLMGVPLLPSYIEAGMEAFDLSAA